MKKLEEIISKITIEEGQSITFNDCPLGDIYVSEGCNLSFNDCPIGNVIPNDLDDAEERIEDLEDRLQSIVGQIDEIES